MIKNIFKTIKDGDLKTLEHLITTNFKEIKEKYIFHHLLLKACEVGNLECLTFLMEIEIPINTTLMLNACARHGHLDCFKYVYNFDKHHKNKCDYAIKAAENGHPHLLTFILQNCCYNEKVTEAAVLYNQPECLKECLKKKVPLELETVYIAVKMGFLDCLKVIAEYFKKDWIFTEYLLNVSVHQNPSIEMLTYLFKEGCPYDSYIFMKEIIKYEDEMINKILSDEYLSPIICKINEEVEEYFSIWKCNSTKTNNQKLKINVAYPESSKKYILEKYTTLNGMKEGDHKMFYSNGQVRSKVPFKNGSIEGRIELRYPNGQMQMIIGYKNGIEHGELRAYNDDGSLNCEGMLKEGEIVGEYKSYYNDLEKIETKTMFKHSRGKSDDYFFFEGYKIRFGLPHGRYEMYHRDGTLKYACEMREGELVKE